MQCKATPRVLAIFLKGQFTQNDKKNKHIYYLPVVVSNHAEVAEVFNICLIDFCYHRWTPATACSPDDGGCETPQLILSCFNSVALRDYCLCFIVLLNEKINEP